MYTSIGAACPHVVPGLNKRLQGQTSVGKKGRLSAEGLLGEQKLTCLGAGVGWGAVGWGGL